MRRKEKKKNRRSSRRHLKTEDRFGRYAFLSERHRSVSRRFVEVRSDTLESYV